MTSIYDDAGNYYGEALVDEESKKNVKAKRTLKRQTSVKRPARKPKREQKKR
jgi:hypothetical protein